MKPKWFSIVIGAVLLTGLALVATPQMAMAATCTTNGSSPLWSYSAAWDCGYVPAAGDVVVIAHNLTLDQNSAALAGVTINPGVTLSGAGTYLLTIGSSTFAGDFINYGAFGSSGGKALFQGNAPQTIGGASTVSFMNLTINNTSGVSLSQSAYVDRTLTLTSGDISVGGNTLTLNDTVSCGASSINSASTGTVNYTLGIAGQNVCAGNYGNLTFNNYAKVLASSNTIGIAGTFTPGSAGHTVTGSTVSFDGTSGAQTIPAFTFYNLTLNNSYGASLNGNVTVDGTLNLANGSLTAGSLALTLNGAVTCNGNTITSYPGTVSYAQASHGQNVCAGNYYNLSFSNYGKVLASSNTIGIAGVFTPGGATGHTVTGSTVRFYGSSSAQTIPAFTFNNLTLSNSAGASLGGSVMVGGALTLTSGSLTVGPYALSLYDTVTCYGNLISSAATGTVYYAQASDGQYVCAGNYGNLYFSDYVKVLAYSGTIGIGGAFGPGSATGHVVSGSTVDFNGTSGGQMIPAFNFNNLILSNSAGASQGGDVIVDGALTLTGSSLAVRSYALTLNGSVTCGGSLTSAANGTVYYAQASGGQNVCAWNYGNLTFSNYNKILAFSGTIGIAGAFTPGSVTGHSVSGSTVDFNGTGGQTIPAFNYNNLTSSSGGARTLASSGTIGVAGAFTPGTNTYTINASTINFNGSGSQTIPAFNYGNLTSSSYGARTLASSGAIGVAGVFTPGTNTYTITGSMINFNGLSGAQTIPAFTFNNLTLSNSSGASLAGNVTVGGVLTLTSGNLAVGAYTLTLNGGVSCGSSSITSAAAGTVSYAQGINGQNVCPGTYGILTLSSFNKTLVGAVTANGAFTLGSGTLTVGGHSLTLNSTVTCGGSMSAPLSSNSTVSYAAAAAQSVCAGTFSHLSLTVPSGSWTKTLAGPVTVGIDLVIGTGVTLADAGYTLTGSSQYSNFQIYNTGTHSGVGKILLIGSNGHWFNGNGIYGNLELNDSLGLGLFADQTINGILTLTTGDLRLSNRTLTMAGAGSGIAVTGAHSFTGPGTVSFTSAKTVTGGTLTFGSNVIVTVGAGVNFGPSISTVNGTLRINAGGWVNTNPPTYGSGSLLQYNSGGTYGRGAEWSATSGPGYPYNVQIGSNTALNYPNGSTAARSMAGALTIESGSALYMDYNNPNPGVSNPLTVGGAVTLNGSLSLGNAIGGDLNVRGNWTFNTGANFYPNSRAVTFNGTSAQTIGGTAATTFDYLTLANSAGVTLNRAATANKTLTLTSGRLTLGSNNLTMGPSAPAISGPFDTTRMIVADGSGALCKQFSATGSFGFPIGDVSGPGGTPDYSPATLNFTGGAFAGGANACVRVVDAAHPNGDQANYPTYITRYWPVTQSGISSFNCTATFAYVQADEVIDPGQSTATLYHWSYSSPNWTIYTQADATNNSLSSNVSSFSDQTARSGSPLAVTLADFGAVQQGDFVLLTWETNSELNNRGFNLYRGTSAAGPDRQLNETLIPSQSQGNPGGFIYTWEDRADLMSGTTYFYWVEDVDINGAATRHGPVSVDFAVPTAVQVSSLQAGSAATQSFAWLWVAAIALLVLALSRLIVRSRRRTF